MKKYTISNDKQNRFEELSFVQINQMKKEDKDEFVKIHVESLMTNMNDDFAQLYLSERFNWLLNTKEVITLAARSRDDKIIGLVYGGPEGYNEKMNKELIVKLLTRILTNPRPFLKLDVLWTCMNQVIAKFFKKHKLQKASRVSKINLPEPVLRLTGIAVARGYDGKGIGNLLIKAYEQKARNNRYEAMILKALSDNISAEKLYLKNGWKKCGVDSQQNKFVYYYKILEC